MDADVVVVGAGLAGLVATAELADAGRRVILLDQEPEASFGGQAFWSLGGLMLVDSPEQRRMRVKDSYELALQDWLGTAGFDRPEDEWPRRWAEAYVGFCAGEKRAWLHEQGMRWLPNPGWPERGGYLADGPGNSVSGSEQNPDTTSRSKRAVLKERLGSGPPSPVQAFMDHGEDFIVERSLPQLVRRMNALAGTDRIDHAALEAQILARDRQLANPYAKDGQVTAIHAARAYTADKVTRVAAPHRILDPKAGPLIAVRLSILTRKSLGGLQTDLDSRVLRPSGEPLPGLYAAGEVAGFGGGGVHGYRALEGTFLGGCLFSGRIAGRAAAAATA